MGRVLNHRTRVFIKIIKEMTTEKKKILLAHEDALKYSCVMSVKSSLSNWSFFEASWWIITAAAAPYAAAADVLIRDAFGRLWFVKGAPPEIIDRRGVTPSWLPFFFLRTGKCQRRGAVLSDGWWNPVIQSGWLIKSRKYLFFPQWSPTEGASNNPDHTASSTHVIYDDN